MAAACAARARAAAQGRLSLALTRPVAPPAPRSAASAAAAAAPHALTLPAPDDWHLHVRDGDGLASVVPHSARHFRRAVIMPNLTPPVTSLPLAEAYRGRVLAAGARFGFEPRMALYLTDNTSPDDVRAAAEADFVHG